MSDKVLKTDEEWREQLDADQEHAELEDLQRSLAHKTEEVESQERNFDEQLRDAIESGIATRAEPIEGPVEPESNFWEISAFSFVKD